MAAHTKLHSSEHQYGGDDDAHSYIDHGYIQGLDSDDHTQYALLAGRSGGQSIVGGTGAGEDLVLDSTSHGTKGDIAVKNASDLVVYSDDLSTEKARIDGATGNITTAGTVDGVDVALLKSDFDTHDGANAKTAHTGGLGDHTHQSAGAEGGKVDHGLALDGLSDDDHTQYALLAGRAGGQIIYGGTGDGDDLTLYSTSHVNKGQILVKDPLDMNSKNITGLADPSNAQDAATKSYVDSLSQGLDWQESVLDKDLTQAPGGPTTGDRYIIHRKASANISAVNQGTKKLTIEGDQSANISAGDTILVHNSTGNDGYYSVVSVTVVGGPSTEIVVNEAIPDATADGKVWWTGSAGGSTWAVIGPEKIAEYNGASWVGTTPNEGMATWVEDENSLYVYNGTPGVGDWVQFGSTVNHNTLSGLQGGTSNQYYHLTSAQQSGLTGGGDIGTTYHNHDGIYYRETEFTATDADAEKPVKTLAAGHLDHTLIKEIYHTSKGAGDPSAGLSEGQACIWYQTSTSCWLVFKTDTSGVKVEMTV
jgi:hypothetical protein